MAPNNIEVAIIGAGPYGLSLASHLSHFKISRRIFGQPMRTWRDMPPGMYLKSFGFATSIPTPQPHHTLPEYCRARGLEDFEPILFQTYAEYGEWFQRELVPDVEQTFVTHLARSSTAFELRLETGESLTARQVIVAAGLGHFQRVPDVLASLPKDLVTHAWETSTFLKTHHFAGRDIVVIGSGQSALEAAALIHEGGGRVQVVARRDVWWSDRFGKRSIFDALRNPNSVMGPGRENWVLQHLPMLPYYLPDHVRVRFTRRHLGPLGAWWLRDRVEGRIPIVRQTSLVSAAMTNGRACLRVRDVHGVEGEIQADHVIAGTGYEADVDRLPFMSAALAREVGRIERAPRLSPHFESSVPGLYFVGPVSAFSFGPIVRFVAGARLTVPRVARHVARSLGKHARLEDLPVTGSSSLEGPVVE